MSFRDKPSTSKAEDNSTKDDSSPESRNVYSERFNPQRALYSEDLLGPKKIKLYSNVAEFEAALTKVGIQQVGRRKMKTDSANPFRAENNLAMTQSKVSDLNPSGRRFEEHQMPVKGSGLKERHQRNLLKKMEDYKNGPLNVLYKAWKSQNKLFISVRKEKGVRGYIYGYLVAFDKHTNLLIRNGYEIWKRRKYKFSPNNAIMGEAKDCSERLKKLGIKLPKTEVKSVDRKYVIIKRKIDQLLIRGEQVCIIREANSKDEEKLDKCIL